MDYGTPVDEGTGDEIALDHAFVRKTIFVILLSCVITALLWIAWFGFKKWRRNRDQDAQIEMDRWGGG